MRRVLAPVLLLLFCLGVCSAQFGSSLPGGRRASDDFDCAEEFGYYPHPTDCSRYYVCVFGGALEETCSSGLVYSTELQTCDWPRNVASCDPRSRNARPSVRSGRLLGLNFSNRERSQPQLFSNSLPASRHAPPRHKPPSHRPISSPRPTLSKHDTAAAAAGGGSSVAERLRLLDDVAQRGATNSFSSSSGGGGGLRDFDLESHVDSSASKVVARRQQTLVHLDESSQRGGHITSGANTFRLTNSSQDSDLPTVSRDFSMHRTLRKRLGSSADVEAIILPHSADSSVTGNRQARRIPFIPPPLREGANPFLRAHLAPLPASGSLHLYKPSSTVVLGGRPDLALFPPPLEPNLAPSLPPSSGKAPTQTQSSSYDTAASTSTAGLRHSNEPFSDSHRYSLVSSIERTHDSYGNNKNQQQQFDRRFDFFENKKWNPNSDELSYNHEQFSKTKIDTKSREYANNTSLHATDSTSRYNYHQNQESVSRARGKPSAQSLTQFLHFGVAPSSYNKWLDYRSPSRLQETHAAKPTQHIQGALKGALQGVSRYNTGSPSSTVDTSQLGPISYRDQDHVAFVAPVERLTVPHISRDPGPSPSRAVYGQYLSEPAADSGYESREEIVPADRIPLRPLAAARDQYETVPRNSHNDRTRTSTLSGKISDRIQSGLIRHRPNLQQRLDVSRRKSHLSAHSQNTLAYIYNYLVGNVAGNRNTDEQLNAYRSPHIVSESGSLVPNHNSVPSYFLSDHDQTISRYRAKAPTPPRLPLSTHPFAVRSETPHYLPDEDAIVVAPDEHFPRNHFRLKPTDAPVQISTLSSFSFGNTGTRFPLRSLSIDSDSAAPPLLESLLLSPRPQFNAQAPSHSRLPPQTFSAGPAFRTPTPPTEPPSRQPLLHQQRTRFPPRHSTSTFVSSTRRPQFSSSQRTPLHRATFSFADTTASPPPRHTPPPTTTTTTAPPPPPPTTTAAGISSHSFGHTEPNYVAFFNDTIYDIYYIYDDDDVQYDDLDYSVDPTPSPPQPPRFHLQQQQRQRRPTTPFASRAVFSTTTAATTSASTTTTTATTTTTTETTTTTPRSRANRIQNVFGPTKHFTRLNKESVSLADIGRVSTLSDHAVTGAVALSGGALSPSRGDELSAATLRRSRGRLNKSKLLGAARGRHKSSGLKSIDSHSSLQSASSRQTKPSRGSSVSKVDIWAHPPRRLDPLYAQPQPDELAERCDARCRLPDCNCGGTVNPGGLKNEDIPQLVLLTFDDSVNDLNRELYEEMFETGRKNPNGCPIAATFYVSHEWTDYKQVQNLYADGHEIASHSISHSFGEQFSTSKWEAEIAGQREILALYGGVRMDDVRGMRAPFLSIGGNRMFKMLYNNNFTYDSSMPVYDNNPPSWPYTLDYKIHHDCMIPPCPTKSYPGVWEVPMVMWQDLNGGRCSMVDACSAPATAEEVYNMLLKNFQRHYSSNRAVFPLYFHAAWMTKKHHREGFMAFLDTISKMDDVWLVTNWQAIQWMRDPQSLNTVKQFLPFGCSYPERPGRCSKAKKCSVSHKSGTRYMTTCQPCPKKYPWTGRTGA